jgi:hypothetical protein
LQWGGEVGAITMIAMASTGTAVVVSDLEGGITQGVSGAAEQGCYY